MPNQKPSFPAARVTDPISCMEGIIVGGEDTVLIGGTAKPIACKDCKAKQLKGNPVNVSTGAKIVPAETDFSLPAPMPFAMDHFYASDTPFTGLLGQGWRTGFETYCDADAKRTRLVDIQGRWIDFAALAPGEEQLCPSETLWLARGTLDKTIPWDERWQWLPEFYRHNPDLFILTPGEGEYLVFEAAVKPAPTEDNPHPLAAGRFDLVAVADRHGYATTLRWRTAHNAANQAVRVPEFLHDSAGRIYRVHSIALPEADRRHWQSFRPDTDNGMRIAGINLAYDPLRDERTPADLAALRDLRVTEWLVRYRYSQAGDLIEVQDGEGDWTRRFEYEQHMLVRHQTPGIDADGVGRDVRYVYDRLDPDGKVIRQEQTGGLDYAFLYGEYATQVIDSLGRKTVYRFQGEAGLRRLIEQHNPDGGVLKFDYTNDGKMLRQTDPLGRQTHFRYSSQGEYLGSTTPLGHRSDLFRDPATGLVTSTRDAAGGITRTQRDAQGRITYVKGPGGGKTQFAYDNPVFPDRPSAITDARGGQKIPAYNALGQIKSFTDCSGQTTRYRHDRKGRLLEVETADGKRQIYERDKKGRLTALIRPDSVNEVVAYDRAGNLVKALDAEGRPVEMAYDRYGRLIERRVWTGGKDDRIVNNRDGWSVTTYQYDLAGRLTRLTNAAGASMAFSYDPMDRLIQETGFDGKSCTYAYNLAGELTASIDNKGEADAVEIRYEFDAGGRLIARHIPACEGGYADTHRFYYNKRDQLVCATTFDSQAGFAYDAAGRLIAGTQSGTDGHCHTLGYGYDILGNRNQVILPDGRSIDTLMYGSGHWHQVAFDGQPLIDVERDSLYREVNRTYGSGSQCLVPHPLTRTQNYTSLGQLGTVRYTRGDKLIERYHHQYNALGLLERLEREGGDVHHVTRYGYDAQQRLGYWDMHDVIPIQPTAGDPFPKPGYRQTRSETYAYDPAGNPVMPGTVMQRDPVSNLPVYTTPQEWAAIVQANAGKADFNLLGATPARADRIAKLGDAFHDEYDGRGNVVKRRTADGRWEFAWNALNQMTASRHYPNGASEPAWAAKYDYDAFGRRVYKLVLDMGRMRRDEQGEVIEESVSGQFMRYLWDGDRMMQEIHATHTRTIVYEPHSFVPLAQLIGPRLPGPELSPEEREAKRNAQVELMPLLANSALPQEAKQAVLSQLRGQAGEGETQLFLFVTDHMGTPYRMLNAATHEAVWERTQDPWGNTIGEWMSGELKPECRPNLRFQGQQWDWETGLYYNRYRYYDPIMRRYLSQDPIKLAGGLNYYSYPTNPVSYIDPMGLDKIGTAIDIADKGKTWWDKAKEIMDIPENYEKGKQGGLEYKKAMCAAEEREKQRIANEEMSPYSAAVARRAEEISIVASKGVGPVTEAANEGRTTLGATAAGFYAGQRPSCEAIARSEAAKKEQERAAMPDCPSGKANPLICKGPYTGNGY